MEKLNEVPVNVITGKDLDYLSDMFQWNYTAYKCAYNNIESMTDMELKDFFNDTATTEIYTLSLHDALPILAKDI